MKKNRPAYELTGNLQRRQNRQELEQVIFDRDHHHRNPTESIWSSTVLEREIREIDYIAGKGCS